MVVSELNADSVTSIEQESAQPERFLVLLIISLCN